MSPSPDRLPQSPKSSTPSQPSMDESPSAGRADATPSAASDTSAAPEAAPTTSPESTSPESTSPESTPLVPKRPLMRPVNRPQPPTPPPTPEKPAQKPAVVSLVTPVSSPASSPAPVSSAPATEYPADMAAVNRMQPIPPPSEPKQYRAIGLVRGCYTPSEEQFTRGTMLTTDGTEIEAVLLGRVMSLVRNHLELTDNHLWVVYPRTRDMENNLHVQIVGVWEPERLNRKQDSEETEETAEADLPPATLPSEIDGSLSPGYDDDYFSIRGEVVFYSPEEQSVVIKIQQAARKGDDKAKAFKLKLTGILDSPKTLGYFWELHVKRQETALVITSGTAIGLVPPKKNPKKGGPRKDRRSPGRPRDARPGGGRPGGPASATPAPRREAIPKPTKRNPQSSEG